MYRGPLVRGVTHCKEFTPPGSASSVWRCVLTLPNSFAPGDGLQLVTEGEGATKDAASEHACRLAFSRLLMASPENVVLHPHQWTVLPNELLAHMPGLVESHQALPVHVNPRREKLATEAASERTVDPPDVWASRVADLLREVLRKHGGCFDPSSISPPPDGPHG